MSDEKFKQVFSFTHIVQVLMLIIGSLIAVIFYGMQGKVDSIDSTTIMIRLELQQVRDEVKVHGDAINQLDRRTDYLEKVKVDK